MVFTGAARRRAAPLSGYRTRRLPGGGAVSRVDGILAKGCLRKQLRRGTIGGSRCGNRLVRCPLSAEVGQFYAHSPHLEAGTCIFGRESASRVCAIIGAPRFARRCSMNNHANGPVAGGKEGAADPQ
jgi:hypothetical protein